MDHHRSHRDHHHHRHDKRKKLSEDEEEGDEKKFKLHELKTKARNERISSLHQKHHKHDKHRKHEYYRNPSKSPTRTTNKNDHHHQQDQIKKTDETKPEIRPNFELTGSLARDTNTFNGVVIKYNEPDDAKKPSKHWRLYPFKGSTGLDHINIHKQSAYLFGRDRMIADIPIDHPSCSKQHAVIQFRLIKTNQNNDDDDDGDDEEKKSSIVCPYLIDLDSSNGTYINNNRIEPRRFIELFEKDVIKFGFSTREYVLLHSQSN